MNKSVKFLFLLIISLGAVGYIAWENLRSHKNAEPLEQTESLLDKPPSPEQTEVRVGSITAFAQLGTEFETPEKLNIEPSLPKSAHLDEKQKNHALLAKFGSKQELLENKASYDKTVEDLQLLETKDGFEAYMEESFRQEPFDSEWAYDYEGLLYEAFANDPVLAGKPIEAVECRSVRCRVQIQLRSTEDMLEVTQILVRKLVQEAEGLNYATFWSNYSAEDNTATWYIGRDREVDILQSDKAH